MTISKPTFGPSTPCTMHFECLESGPNDSTRVRRLTGILRRALVKIFILAYGSFWVQLSGFSSNLTAWAPRNQNCKTMCKTDMELQIKNARRGRPESIPNLPSRQTPSNLVMELRTSPHFPERTYIKRGKRASFQFSATLGGGIFTSVRLHDENSGATDSGRPLLPLWPISCVCM
jgi:hypothetical protein